MSASVSASVECEHEHIVIIDSLLDPVFSTVPSVRNSLGRDGTANRRPSEGRTETVPSF